MAVPVAPAGLPARNATGVSAISLSGTRDCSGPWYVEARGAAEAR